MGVVVGGYVYFFVLIDFVIMVDQISQMFIIGFDVIKIVIGEEVIMEEFGGVYIYMVKLGMVYYVVLGEQDVFDYVCELLSYLLFNNFIDVF